MPRKSPEDRSMNVFRLPKPPPEPPADLTPEGKTIWRETVRERPGDWFSPVSTRLLLILVQQLVACGDLQRLYDAQEDYRMAAVILKQLLSVSSNCANIASKLRLTPQALVDRRSGRITESGPGDAEDDGLLGGGGPAWGMAQTKKGAVECEALGILWHSSLAGHLCGGDSPPAGLCDTGLRRAVGRGRPYQAAREGRERRF
jgi:hypothetical protein